MKINLNFLFIVALFSLAGCNIQNEPAASCPETPQMRADMDMFDIDWSTIEIDKFAYCKVSRQEQSRLTKNAYRIGEFSDSDYADSYYFTKSTILNRKGVCHSVLYGAMDDFAGIYLILDNKQSEVSTLYLAGVDGSSNTVDSMYVGAPETKGRILNDTTILTNTVSVNYAFPESGKKSFIDSVSRIYRINYKKSKFDLIKRDSMRRYSNEYFF